MKTFEKFINENNNIEKIYKLIDLMKYTNDGTGLTKLKEIFLNRYVVFDDPYFDLVNMRKIKGYVSDIKIGKTSSNRYPMVNFIINGEYHYVPPEFEIKIIEPKIIITPEDPFGEEDWMD